MWNGTSAYFITFQVSAILQNLHFSVLRKHLTPQNPVYSLSSFCETRFPVTTSHVPYTATHSHVPYLPHCRLKHCSFQVRPHIPLQLSAVATYSLQHPHHIRTTVSLRDTPGLWSRLAVPCGWRELMEFCWVAFLTASAYMLESVCVPLTRCIKTIANTTVYCM
jgi:hypothetical protein